MSPTGRAALGVALVAVLAVALPWWVAAVLGLAVAGATLADALVARRPVELTRSLPSSLARGVPAGVSFDTAPVPGRIRIRQAASPDLAIGEQEGETTLATTITARRRGRHVLPSPAARVVGPLGLAAWYRRPGRDVEVLVYPDLPAAQRLATSVRRGRFRHEGRARGPLGLGTEFESIRDYEPDDDVRQVNWRATQRVGRPMSNQYRVDTDRDVICLVDCGRLMAAPLLDRTRLDAAVDAAAAIGAVADVLADRCGAIAFDARVSRDVAPRRSGGRAVVKALFDVEPVAVESNYLAAFAALAERKRAWVILFTDLLEVTAAGPLLEALPALARKHVVAIATATDPELENLLSAPPRDRIDVYRAAVAFDVVRARRQVVSELRRRGIDVVDAAPDRLASACVRAYLRAKVRARV
jgi:uncharacterized protein (DUF58 family)